MTQQQAIDKMTCGYAAVNNGKHCIINGKCVICHTQEANSMSDEQIKNMRIENLIHRLNALGVETKTLLDRVWELENQKEEMRIELMGLITGKKHV